MTDTAISSLKFTVELDVRKPESNAFGYQKVLDWFSGDHRNISGLLYTH